MLSNCSKPQICIKLVSRPTVYKAITLKSIYFLSPLDNFSLTLVLSFFPSFFMFTCHFVHRITFYPLTSQPQKSKVVTLLFLIGDVTNDWGIGFWFLSVSIGVNLTFKVIFTPREYVPSNKSCSIVVEICICNQNTNYAITSLVL